MNTFLVCLRLEPLFFYSLAALEETLIIPVIEMINEVEMLEQVTPDAKHSAVSDESTEHAPKSRPLTNCAFFELRHACYWSKRTHQPP